MFSCYNLYIKSTIQIQRVIYVKEEKSEFAQNARFVTFGAAAVTLRCV